MLIHDLFVFLHTPKTGGRFVRSNLERELGKMWSPPSSPPNLHHGWDAIPAWARDKPVLAFVRNPWDWYVSWYHFMVKGAETALRRPFAPSVACSLSYWLLVEETVPGSPPKLRHFDAVVQRACCTSAHPWGRVRIEHARRLPERRAAAKRPTAPEPATPWLPVASFGRRLAEGHDIYSAGLMTSLGQGLESNRLTIGNFESLIEDLKSFLDLAGVDLSSDAVRRIDKDQARNVGERGPYREYYDDELRELVGASCNGLAERFGYRF